MDNWRTGLLAVAPALVLWLGVLGAAWIQPAQRLELVEPLGSFPTSVQEYGLERRLEIPEGSLAVLRPDDYIVRRYKADGRPDFELFVAYYGKQLEGATIHSPRNCLPGSGWEPVEHRRIPLQTGGGSGTVNRYVIQNRRGERALVYYWYQGRGRIEANEYLVKWDLLRDAVVKRRTDEALVRLVFPLDPGSEVELLETRSLVRSVADALSRHLPAG